MDRGVLYIATGQKYIKEVRSSAKSLRKHMPEINVTLYTDHQIDLKYVDTVRKLPNPKYSFGDSVISPDMVPYDRTLFLDTDTYITSPIFELFEILDRFDIACAHNPSRNKMPYTESYAAQGVPDSFPQYNTGVISLKQSKDVSEFLVNWNRIYEKNTTKGYLGELNQPSFREALYHSNLHIATLTPEYNCRITRAGFLHGPVKILHGGHPDIELVEERLNSDTGMRVFTTKRWPIQVIDEKSSIWWRLVHNLKSYGLKYTLRKSSFKLIKILKRFLNNIL